MAPITLTDEQLANNPAHDFAESIMNYAEQVTPLLRPTDFNPLIARKSSGYGHARLMIRRPALHGWAMSSDPLLAQLIELDQIGDGLIEPCDAAVYLLGSGTKVISTPRWFAVDYGIVKVRVGPERKVGRLVHLTACTSRTLDFLA